MNIISPGLQFYVNLIKQGEPFTFNRYGDGAWSAILADGRKRTGSGSHSLTSPVMQAELRYSMLRRHQADNYFVAFRRTAMKPSIRKWLRRHAPNAIWHDCTVFYKSSRKGRLYPFIQAIRDSGLPVIVIGPPRLRKLNSRVLKLADFVDIPGKDCYPKKDKVVKRVLNFGKPAIITISAGPPGKIMAYELFRHIGKHSFILDLGSLWDVYCGKRTRQYMKSMKPATIRRNLHGK